MDPLLKDGISALRALLPDGVTLATSGLNRQDSVTEHWVALRGPGKVVVTCLLISRKRMETRDIGGVAAIAAKTRNPAVLISTYLSPVVRDRLRGFGLGHLDLAGNVRVALPALDLCIEQEGGAAPAGAKADRSTRSLCGEMSGRVARVLVDLPPPLAVSAIAEEARVESSCASRVLSFLGDAGLVERKPRGKVEKVDWKEILRRWSLDCPCESRGEFKRFTCARGVAEFMARLAQSGYLHALTGEAALARMTHSALPESVMLYVDDVEAAVAQFALHPSESEGNVVLIRPADRGVFHRSVESAGLRYVSPSLMAADLKDRARFESALAWMGEHEASWR